VPITIKVVGSIAAHGEMYSIQHYMIVCQWLATGLWFSPGTPVSSTNKTDRHDITEILLKVALNIITPYNIMQLVLQNIMYYKYMYIFHSKDQQ